MGTGFSINFLFLLEPDLSFDFTTTISRCVDINIVHTIQQVFFFYHDTIHLEGTGVRATGRSGGCITTDNIRCVESLYHRSSETYRRKAMNMEYGNGAGQT